MKLPTRSQFWSDVDEATEPFLVMGIFSIMTMIVLELIF